MDAQMLIDEGVSILKEQIDDTAIIACSGGIDSTGNLSRPLDLHSILEPGVHPPPVEAEISLHVGELRMLLGIRPDGVFTALSTGAHRPVAGVAFVGAVGGQIGAVEEAHVDILLRQVVHRCVA